MDELQSNDRAIRLRAMASLNASDQAIPGALPFLTPLLDDVDGTTANMAAEAIGRQGVVYHGAATRLLPWLDEPNPTRRAIAARALAVVAPRSEQLQSTLMRWLAGDEQPLRRVAVQLLTRIRPMDAACLNRVLELLADSRPEVRIAATQVAASMGPGAVELIPALARNLKSEDANVRLVGLLALRHVGGSAGATSSVEDCLDDEHKSIKIVACHLLGETTAASPELIARLTDLQGSSDTDLAGAATAALECIQGEDSP
jgi:hypothetical protein